jgi:antirestriction protein ArdC
MRKERHTHRPRPFQGEVAPAPDRHRELLDRLEAQVSAIQDSDTFRQWLSIQAKFHRYSWGNVGVILSQRPDATRVAGYRTWQALGRQVRRGEQAIKIFVPMTRKAENTEAGEEERKLFFGIGHVFDIGQTDGPPLAQVEVPVLEGDEGGVLYTQLEQLAGEEGVTVTRRGDLGPGMRETMGYYRPGEPPAITVRHASQLQMTKTLAHELGHHFTGLHETYDEHRDAHETVAESVAYVVLAHFGLDSGARSFPYVATWAKDTTTLRSVLGTIQGVAAAIIDRIEQRFGGSASLA